MKKLLGIMLAGIIGVALSVGLASAASSDCLNVNFYNGDSVCLGLTKNGSKNYEISIDKNNLEKNSTIRCYVVLPNNTMYSIYGCKGSFSYAGAGTKDVIVSATYITKNDNFYSKRMSTDINFNKGTWASSSNTSSSSSSSSNSDEIELSTNRKSPSTSQYVNLTIETDDDYVGKLSLSAKYRSSSSSSWSSISNTSSTYFSDYSDEWEDGYYKMRSSDDGKVTLNNIVKFKKNGYYRIYVEDTKGNESYIQFSVGDVDDDDNDESSVDGFSVKQLNAVKKVYKEWNSMIGQMQRKYPSLKKDTYWIKLSDNFYDDMKDVINNKKYRDFSDYNDFQDAFDDWYKYTMRNI